MDLSKLVVYHKKLTYFLIHFKRGTVMRINEKQRAWRKFLKLLIDELSGKTFCDIAVVSFLNGRPNDTTPFSDLDLLIILNNPPSTDPTNSKNYFGLIKILKIIQPLQRTEKLI